MFMSLKIGGIFLIAVLIPKGDTAHDHATDAISDVGYTHIVYTYTEPKCSGALLSRMWTITTCLCIQNVPSNQIYVRVGDPTLKQKNKKKDVYYRVNKATPHPECFSSDNEYHVEHNLALLLLEEPVFDSLVVNIIKVPNQLMYWTPDSDLGLDLASWTDLNYHESSLHKSVWHMNSSILQDKDCIKHFGKKDFKPKQTTCASYHHNGGKNECELDIGAPLGYDYILIGILVHKVKCGEQKKIASFVNIPMHSKWIRQTTSEQLSWILV